MRILNSAIMASRMTLWLAMSLTWSTAQASFIGYDAENDLMTRDVSIFPKAKNAATAIAKEASLTPLNTTPTRTPAQINELSYGYSDGNLAEVNVETDSSVPNITYKSSVGGPANPDDANGINLRYMGAPDMVNITLRRDGNDIDKIQNIDAVNSFILSHKAFDDSSYTSSVGGIFAGAPNLPDNKFTNYSNLPQNRQPHSAAQTDSFVLWVLYKLVAFGVSEVIVTVVVAAFSFGAIMRLFEKTPNGN